MRKTTDASPSSSPHRLALVLLCAFSGCLNPLPEEYPSNTSSPVEPGDDAAGSSRESADDPSANTGPNLDIAGEPDNASVPPPSVLPPRPPDAGAPPASDAGPGDAGLGDEDAADAGAPPNGD